MEVGGLTLVSGLEWQALMGIRSPASEKREIARELNATRHVEMSNGHETIVGFLPGEMAAGLPKKLYSLSALLAGVPNISPYCVLVLEEGDVAILAALQDGLPAPGFDGYGSTEEVIATARDFINMAPEGVTVYGNCRLLDATPLTLEAIVQQTKTTKQGLLKNLPNPYMKAAVLLGLIALFSGTAYYAYNYQKKQEQAAAQLRSVVNVDAKYLENVFALLQASNPAKPTLTMLKAAIDQVDISNNGWSLTNILCNKTACTYNWKNDGGTNSSFNPPANVTGLSFSDKGDTLTYQVPYAQSLPMGVVSGQALSLETIRRNVVGKFQEYADLKVSSSFEKADIFGIPPGLPGTPAKTVKEGIFSVEGPWFAFEVLENLPDATAFESLDINISADQQLSFKAMGKYYVK